MALTTNLTAYWKLEEASGTREDATASNLDLTDNNTVLSGTGKINTCADFEDTNDEYLSRADGSLEPAGAFSFSLWINYEELPGAAQDDGILGKWNSTGNQRSYAIAGFNNAGTHQLAFFVSPDGVNNFGAFVNSGVSISTWYHLVGIFTPSTSIELYLNNTRIQNTTASVPASAFGSTAEFRLGDYVSATSPFDGLIDEVGFWDRALTSAEVTELYNAGAGLAYPFSPPGPANLKSYNTNVTANIKSINTNPIANIKSLNTNV